MAGSIPGLHCRWNESGPADGVSRDVAVPKTSSHQPLLQLTPKTDPGLPGKLCLESSREPREGARVQAELLGRCTRRLNISG